MFRRIGPGAQGPGLGGCRVECENSRCKYMCVCILYFRMRASAVLILTRRDTFQLYREITIRRFELGTKRRCWGLGGGADERCYGWLFGQIEYLATQMNVPVRFRSSGESKKILGGLFVIRAHHRKVTGDEHIISTRLRAPPPPLSGSASTLHMGKQVQLWPLHSSCINSKHHQ